MSDDVKEWLTQCVACVKRKYPVGNIPTGHRWDRLAMDILDVCDPRWSLLHLSNRRLFQQMDRGLPHEE